MSRPSDREALLVDVLAEAESPDFRTSLLGETLRLARRRRRVRRAQLATIFATAVLVAGIFVWRAAPRPPVVSLASSPSTPPALAASYAVIRTQPLPAETIVRTQPLSAERLVGSFASIATIRTQPDETALRIIDDAELLALVAPRPAALIRVGPQTQELVFGDTAEQPGSRE